MSQNTKLPMPIVEHREKILNSITDLSPEKETIELGIVPLGKMKGKDYFPYLDSRIDEIEFMIINGIPILSIAEKLGVPFSSFYMWRGMTEHKERIDVSFEMSSEYMIQKAEEILLYTYERENEDVYISEIGRRGNQGNMARSSMATQLSKYYQWLAAIRNSKVYGKKEEEPKKKEEGGWTDEQLNKILNIVEAQKKRGEEIEFEEVAVPIIKSVEVIERNSEINNEELEKIISDGK